MSLCGERSGRSDRTAGLFARDQSSTAEPPVSTREATAFDTRVFGSIGGGWGRDVEVARIHATGGSNRPIISLDQHRNDTAKMEHIVTLHGNRAAALDGGIDGWLQQMMHDTGVVSTLNRSAIVGERLDEHFTERGFECVPVALRTQWGRTAAIADEEQRAVKDVALETVHCALIPNSRRKGSDAVRTPMALLRLIVRCASAPNSRSRLLVRGHPLRGLANAEDSGVVRMAGERAVHGEAFPIQWPERRSRAKACGRTREVGPSRHGSRRTRPIQCKPAMRLTAFGHDRSPVP